MEIVIYGDLLFAINFLMDSVIVFFTCLLTPTDFKVWKIMLASAILSLYGTIAFNPELLWVSAIPIRVIVSAIAILIFGLRINFLKRYIVFWAVSIFIGGAVYYVTMSTDVGRVLNGTIVDGYVYLDMDIRMVVSAIVVAYALILFTKLVCVRKFEKDDFLVPIAFRLGGRDYKITALIDTGCEITLPITNEGVLLVGKDIFKGEVPGVPYMYLNINTVAGKDKIPVFYPEKIKCFRKEYIIDKSPPIGVVNNPLSSDGMYKAILNPCILNENKYAKKREGVLK